ncbi:hypothetical protein ACLKA7_000956 [Drosophila subpalustris]
MRTEESHGTSGKLYKAAVSKKERSTLGQAGRYRLERCSSPPQGEIVIPSSMKEPDKLLLIYRDAAGGELNFGFSSFSTLYKSDATPANGLSDKPAEEDITEEL